MYNEYISKKVFCHLSNCAEHARPPAAAQLDGWREFGLDQDASNRGRPELSDKVTEPGEPITSREAMRWVEFNWKEVSL